jgi:23S rRNA (uridine2552-2'-O)-methyltransferase
MAPRPVEALGGKADRAVADMAPNTTGHSATDHLWIVALAEAAPAFALEVLAEGGGFVAKMFQGGGADGAGGAQAAFFVGAACEAPASRKGSSEPYVVAMGFRGGGRRSGE